MLKRISISLFLIVTYLFVVFHNVIPHSHGDAQTHHVEGHHHSHHGGHHHHHEVSVLDNLLIALGDLIDLDLGSEHFENYLSTDNTINIADLGLDVVYSWPIANEKLTVNSVSVDLNNNDPPPLWVEHFIISKSHLRAPPIM